MKINVLQIFEEEPQQWGLRGDPFLWEDIKNSFSTVLIPYSEKDFLKAFTELFLKFTGISIESKGPIHIEKYSRGGMSSGMIDPELWKQNILTLLLKRLEILNTMYEKETK